jgi:hypothetical protein
MSLNSHNLSIYLNDHLAGSVAALELLRTVASLEGLEEFGGRLWKAVEDDKNQLESLMQTLSIAPSTTRRAASWLTGKLAELKMGLDDHSTGFLRRLELLEALALGVEGKQALWYALEAAAADEPSLAKLDYRTLIARASEQRVEIEGLRVETASLALRNSSPGIPVQRADRE